MSNTLSIKAKSLLITGILSTGLLVSGNAKAHSDHNYLGLAAPVILYSLLNNRHHEHGHYRITRHHRHDRHPPRRHSHSQGGYKRGHDRDHGHHRGYKRGGHRHHQLRR